MDLNWLVVSDPPHDQIDLAEAGELLGLTSAETVMKTNFGAPEVWLALENEGEAADAAQALHGAGLSVLVVDANDLVSAPGPAPAASFSFGEDGLVAQFEDGEVELSYDTPVFGVFCKPPAGFGSPAAKRGGSTIGRSSTLAFVETRGAPTHGLQVAHALELMANLDLYTSLGGQPSRISIAQDVVDFSGLGDLKQPSGSGNMSVAISECQRRFPQFTLDARLENVRPRQRAMVGTAGAAEEGRRLLSFGTMGLRSLLESVSPDLKELTQSEFGSRLAYLMHERAGVGAI